MSESPAPRERDSVDGAAAPRRLPPFPAGRANLDAPHAPDPSGLTIRPHQPARMETAIGWQDRGRSSSGTAHHAGNAMIPSKMA